MEQLRRIFAWLSQGLNVTLLLGSEDMTVSARCWVNRDKRGWRTAYKVINVLFFWQHDHCLLSFCYDAAHAAEVVEIHEKNGCPCDG